MPAFISPFDAKAIVEKHYAAMVNLQTTVQNSPTFYCVSEKGEFLKIPASELHNFAQHGWVFKAQVRNSTIEIEAV